MTARPTCAISAVQCWTSIEEYFGVVPCTVMSMMSDNLFPAPAKWISAACSACTRCALASETPSALLDWNNNYGDDPEQGRLLPLQQSAQTFLPGRPHGLPGNHRRHRGQGKHLRHCRGPGEARSDELRALFHRRHRGHDARLRRRRPLHRRSAEHVRRRGRGGDSADLQKLLHYICENGFEHHVAANFSTVAGAVHEAATRYLGWEYATGTRVSRTDATHGHCCRSRFRHAQRARLDCGQRARTAGLRGRRISAASQARRS